MIHGHKPSAYFQTFSREGVRIEGEQRQCCHCQYTWEYKPGSGDRRGWCLKHEGFLCARPECALEQDRVLALYSLSTGKVASCLSADEWNDYLGNRQLQLKGEYHVSDAGLIVPGVQGAS